MDSRTLCPPQNDTRQQLNVPPVDFHADAPGRQAAGGAQRAAGGRPGHQQVAAAELRAQAGAAGDLHLGARLLRRRPDRLRHAGVATTAV
jgi:hypothetical protein